MTMSPVFMVFALVGAFLCHNGDCSRKCSKPLTDNQMFSETNCLAGYYQKEKCGDKRILCEVCGEGRYTEKNNTASMCHACHVCSTEEVASRECTNRTNRECSCKDGFYRSFILASRSICQTCTTCLNCSTCPECKGNCGSPSCGQGQFLDRQGTCQSCADNSCLDKSCSTFCNKVPPTPLKLVSEIVLCILVLLGLSALCCFICEASRNRHLCCWAHIKNANGQNKVPPNTPTLPDQPGDQPDIHLPLNIIPGNEVKDPETRDKQRHLDSDLSGQITAPLIIHGDIKGQPEPSRNEPEKGMWPAPVLYTIIKQVPVRRWKEFLRLLSLSDDQMERLELEARGSYLELQYQMLRLWSQMNGARLETICSTLHNMDLSGCAEELQEKLQQLQETMV